MKKILISIKKNYLAFSYKNSKNNNSDKLLNTNVISDNELVFSDEYIERNQKIVSCFIKEICEQYNIHIISFAKNEMAHLLFPLFNKNSLITTLYLFEETNLPFYLCEMISKNSNIKKINCYNVPTFMIEMLDRKNVEVVSRNEILFTSNFMENNNLTQFSKIFYKISVRLELPLSEKDIEDFVTFCKINKYLRTIHLDKANAQGIEQVIKVLKDNRLTKIKILIHDNVTDEHTVAILKKLNKNSKKHKISFKLVYSDDYLRSNVLNQTIVSILKICGAITTCLIVTVLGYIFYSNYQGMQKVTQIKDDIAKVIEKNDTKDIVEELNKENLGTSLVITNDYIASLLTVNKDTVGWLKLNNTNIDYPIVQYTDNKYYLKKNYYHENDKAGWVFMDYRNDPKVLNKNTIFYGHNYLSSGIMFGTLGNALKKDWYTKPENQIIEFNTLYESMKWQIFSIYRIDVTTDYMKTTFDNDEEWLQFANMLKNRSINDFGIEIKPEDKIISLSTCIGANNQQRLVVHAILKSA